MASLRFPPSPRPVAKPAAREVDGKPSKRPASIVEAIGSREEVEPEVIMRAETTPPPASVLEDLGELSSPAQAGTAHDDEDEDVSIEVMVDEAGVHDFPEFVDEDAPLDVEQVEDEASQERPVGQEETEQRATEPEALRQTRIYVTPERTIEQAGPPTCLERLRDHPWELSAARELLEEPESVHAHPSAHRVVDSLLNLVSEDPGSFKAVRPVFRDSRTTRETFTSLVGSTAHESWLEALGILWDAAPTLFKERIADYDLRTADQITPFSTGPVAPILEKAIRSLGYVRMGVYTRRGRGYAVHVIRTTPPSIGVKLPMGRLPTSLEFYLGRCFWAVGPPRVLAFSLPLDTGRATLDAMLAAFGSPDLEQGRMDGEASRLTQDMWSMVPAAAQNKLRHLLDQREAVPFDELQSEVKRQCTRAGVLFSADLGSAVFHHLPEDASVSPAGRLSEQDLSDHIRATPTIRDAVRFALSEEVLDFLDDVLD
jgi:hypothetical protein